MEIFLPLTLLGVLQGLSQLGPTSILISMMIVIVGRHLKEELLGGSWIRWRLGWQIVVVMVMMVEVSPHVNGAVLYRVGGLL